MLYLFPTTGFTSGGMVIALDLPFVSRIFTFRYSISSKHLLADVFDTPQFFGSC